MRKAVLLATTIVAALAIAAPSFATPGGNQGGGNQGGGNQGGGNQGGGNQGGGNQGGGNQGGGNQGGGNQGGGNQGGGNQGGGNQGGGNNGPVGVNYDPTAGVVFGTLYNGNDCSGSLGQGFANCALNGSPAIAKFEPQSLGGFSMTDRNGTAFPSISTNGSEFSLVLNPGGLTGSFTYTPGTGDPLVTSYVLKAGNFWKAYQVTMSGLTPITLPFSIDWDRGLSHITFYDTACVTNCGGGGGGGPGGGGGVVPVPASIALFGVALLGLGMVARRRQA
jgi:hypothetical protein